jgi:Uncharacterized ACR, COG1678
VTDSRSGYESSIQVARLTSFLFCGQCEQHPQIVTTNGMRRRNCFFFVLVMIRSLLLITISLCFSSTTIYAFHGIPYLLCSNHNKRQGITNEFHSITQQLHPQINVLCKHVVPLLSASSDNENSSSITSTTTFTSNQNDNNIKFLGKGTNAIVRLGCVLIAPQNEYHHFYRQSAIFIYAMGYEEETTTIVGTTDNATTTTTYYIRGVIIDHPTPFTVQEMIPNIGVVSSSSTTSQQQRQHPLFNNLIFRGGDKGRENSVLLLHNQKYVPGGSEEIGTSGLYHGGFDSVVLLNQSYTEKINTTTSTTTTTTTIDLDSNNFKFFFNYCEFTEDEIEELFRSNEDNDSWASVEITDPYILLNNDWDRGDCWRYIRNSILRQQNV